MVDLTLDFGLKKSRLRNVKVPVEPQFVCDFSTQWRNIDFRFESNASFHEWRPFHSESKQVGQMSTWHHHIQADASMSVLLSLDDAAARREFRISQSTKHRSQNRVAVRSVHLNVKARVKRHRISDILQAKIRHGRFTGRIDRLESPFESTGRVKNSRDAVEDAEIRLREIVITGKRR